MGELQQIDIKKCMLKKSFEINGIGRKNSFSEGVRRFTNKKILSTIILVSHYIKNNIFKFYKIGK